MAAALKQIKQKESYHILANTDPFTYFKRKGYLLDYKTAAITHVLASRKKIATIQTIRRPRGKEYVLTFTDKKYHDEYKASHIQINFEPSSFIMKKGYVISRETGSADTTVLRQNDIEGRNPAAIIKKISSGYSLTIYDGPLAEIFKKEQARLKKQEPSLSATIPRRTGSSVLKLSYDYTGFSKGIKSDLGYISPLLGPTGKELRNLVGVTTIDYSLRKKAYKYSYKVQMSVNGNTYTVSTKGGFKLAFKAPSHKFLYDPGNKIRMEAFIAKAFKQTPLFKRYGKLKEVKTEFLNLIYKIVRRAASAAAIWQIHPSDIRIDKKESGHWTPGNVYLLRIDKLGYSLRFRPKDPSKATWDKLSNLKAGKGSRGYLEASFIFGEELPKEFRDVAKVFRDGLISKIKDKLQVISRNEAFRIDAEKKRFGKLSKGRKPTDIILTYERYSKGTKPLGVSPLVGPLGAELRRLMGVTSVKYSSKFRAYNYAYRLNTTVNGNTYTVSTKGGFKLTFRTISHKYLYNPNNRSAMKEYLERHLSQTPLFKKYGKLKLVNTEFLDLLYLAVRRSAMAAAIWQIRPSDIKIGKIKYRDRTGKSGSGYLLRIDKLGYSVVFQPKDPSKATWDKVTDLRLRVARGRATRQYSDASHLFSKGLPEKFRDVANVSMTGLVEKIKKKLQVTSRNEALRIEAEKKRSGRFSQGHKPNEIVFDYERYSKGIKPTGAPPFVGQLGAELRRLMGVTSVKYSSKFRAYNYAYRLNTTVKGNTYTVSTKGGFKLTVKAPSHKYLYDPNNRKNMEALVEKAFKQTFLFKKYGKLKEVNTQFLGSMYLAVRRTALAATIWQIRPSEIKIHKVKYSDRTDKADPGNEYLLRIDKLGYSLRFRPKDPSKATWEKVTILRVPGKAVRNYYDYSYVFGEGIPQGMDKVTRAGLIEKIRKKLKTVSQKEASRISGARKRLREISDNLRPTDIKLTRQKNNFTLTIPKLKLNITFTLHDPELWDLGSAHSYISIGDKSPVVLDWAILRALREKDKVDYSGSDVKRIVKTCRKSILNDSQVKKIIKEIEKADEEANKPESPSESEGKPEVLYKGSASRGTVRIRRKVPSFGKEYLDAIASRELKTFEAGVRKNIERLLLVKPVAILDYRGMRYLRRRIGNYVWGSGGGILITTSAGKVVGTIRRSGPFYEIRSTDATFRKRLLTELQKTRFRRYASQE